MSPDDERAERQHMLATLDLLIVLVTVEQQRAEREEAEKQRIRELNPTGQRRYAEHWRKAS